MIESGDWLQATEQIAEDDFQGEDVWVHAECGGVGHALDTDGDWINVFWERTGTVCVAHVSQLKRLGGALIGRAIAL